jgi:uncharacterized FAD-dependent dehydrogenase
MIYDLAIIGAGVAGCFAAQRLEENYNLKILLLDLGRPFAKRRRQIEGAMGCLPSGDGKWYCSQMSQFNEFDGRKVNAAKKWLDKKIDECGNSKIIKDSLPSNALRTRANKLGYSIKPNDYIQWKPDSVHKLSKIFSDTFENSQNIKMQFDTEVFKILKKKNQFTIHTESQDFLCKKILFCPGRSGWRWANDFYKELGMEVQDDYSYYGVRFEIAGQYAKDLQKTNCTLYKDDVEIGPFLWNGTVIPEDHADMVISSFRSNEERWKSEKVNFSYINKFKFENDGVNQTERIAKLTYLLFNDRVSREKNRIYLKGNSQLNLLPEYTWLKNAIEEVGVILPEFVTKGYYHIPEILPLPGKIEIDDNHMSEVSNLFVAGESAGYRGIMGAAISGILAAEGVVK